MAQMKLEELDRLSILFYVDIWETKKTWRDENFGKRK